MAKLKEGDTVRIVAREQTNADQKSGLYYPHFANLTGTILKIYGEEASVLVDREALPEDVRTRHEANQETERQRYLDRLSEDARKQMESKEFTLRYAVLVALSDLEPNKDGAKSRRATNADLDAAEEAHLKQRP
ncbi:MAG: hypothetical protein OHK0029_39380 [Armatimonadaceae bacterium]